MRESLVQASGQEKLWLRVYSPVVQIHLFRGPTNEKGSEARYLAIDKAIKRLSTAISTDSHL